MAWRGAPAGSRRAWLLARCARAARARFRPVRVCVSSGQASPHQACAGVPEDAAACARMAGVMQCFCRGSLNSGQLHCSFCPSNSNAASIIAMYARRGRLGLVHTLSHPPNRQLQPKGLVARPGPCNSRPGDAPPIGRSTTSLSSGRPCSVRCDTNPPALDVRAPKSSRALACMRDPLASAFAPWPGIATRGEHAGSRTFMLAEWYGRVPLQARPDGPVDAPVDWQGQLLPRTLSLHRTT